MRMEEFLFAAICICIIYNMSVCVWLLVVVDGDDDDDNGGNDKICVALNVLNSLSTTNDEKMYKSLT